VRGFFAALLLLNACARGPLSAEALRRESGRPCDLDAGVCESPLECVGGQGIQGQDLERRCHLPCEDVQACPNGFACTRLNDGPDPGGDRGICLP
jgi:hypothetical protein